MPLDTLLLSWADYLAGATHDLLAFGHTSSVHAGDSHEGWSGEDFLMLAPRPAPRPVSLMELKLPKRFAKRLAVKAVDKAAWLHDAVLDFQETDFFWEARRFARRHAVAEAFGLGVVAGGVWLLTAPPPRRTPAKRQPDPAQAAAAELHARRAGNFPRRVLGAPPLPPVPRAPAAVRLMEDQDPFSGPDDAEADDHWAPDEDGEL
mmetsp:Transcript_11384/g.27312  ORF Transcript_11384/g.27312 Transcript_11384/m.27312 type:complete len:205 (+) Transcript_11384:51-665(+)